MFGNGKNGVNGANGPRSEALIDLKGIRKVYDTGAIKVEALRGVDMTVTGSELIAIMGPSGSGKSTIMNIIGCLDTPSAGSYRLKGEEVGSFSIDRLAEVRNRRIGFVFQNFNLLPQLTAFENVELPLLFAGRSTRERRERVEKLFEQVGLADRMRHKPTELSGGQMQRVAIARALACEPDIILADEPTGNLDSTSGKDIIHLFEELWQNGHTVVLITHDPSIAARTHRVVKVQDGLIVEDAA
jgi:putative ABC transport system ATP-binding protein